MSKFKILNGTTSNYLQLPLLVLIYFLPFPSYVENCYNNVYMYLLALLQIFGFVLESSESTSNFQVSLLPLALA